jgi:hypothetical protein
MRPSHPPRVPTPRRSGPAPNGPYEVHLKVDTTITVHSRTLFDASQTRDLEIDRFPRPAGPSSVVGLARFPRPPYS